MRPQSLLTAGLLAALAGLGLAFAACGSGDDDGASTTPNGDTQTFSVTLTDDGCDPATIDAHTGPATFNVTNDGAAGVTEFEILDGDNIIGEVENIIAGISGQFSLNLRAGTYTTYCPGGGENERGVLTVTGEDPTESAGVDPDLDAATTTYHEYVSDQSDQLLTAVKALESAIGSGDLNAARDAYVAARPYYERIEPVAESFGDLDPKIDARADEVPADQLTGFHRIEFGLWVDNSTDGLDTVAAQLVTDVTTLHGMVPTFGFDALQIANGAVELLSEVSQSKITGEEERYSHVDLLDFAANVDGAKAAFDAVRAALARRDSDLATTVDARFTDVYDALSQYKDTNGDYVSYEDLTEADTRALAQAVDALGEPLSQVASTLTQAPQS